MSKELKTKRTSNNRPAEGSRFKLSKGKETALSIIFLTVLVFAFFGPTIFGNKTFQSGDILTQYSYKNYAETNEDFLWDPFIFCGMPLFGHAGWNDVLNQVLTYTRLAYSSFMTNEYSGFTFYLLLLGIGVFFLMKQLKSGTGAALFSATSVIFSSGIIVLLFIGHINKLSTLAAFPFILLFILRLNEKLKLMDILGLTLALKIMFSQWHVQIIFYVFLTLVIYYAFYLIRSFAVKEKDQIKALLKSGLVLTACSIIAFSMQYYKLGQMYEYTEYSTRGTKGIEDISSSDKSATEENFYEYATNWSFSPGEVMTFFIPSFYGYGNSTYTGELTQGSPVEVNTYFGQMPFTDVANYMGTIVFLLALAGFWLRRKESFVQFMALTIVLFLIISFGKNFPFLYDIFFKYVPFFDKFRAPVMILNIVQIFFPILAGLGLARFVELSAQKSDGIIKILKYSLITFAALLFLSLLAGGMLENWFRERITDAGENYKHLNPLHPYMTDMFMRDLRFALLLGLVLSSMIYAMMLKKTKSALVISALILFSLIDLWLIDYRGLHFKEMQDLPRMYAKPGYVEFVQKDKSEPFRILNLKQNGSLGSLNNHANFHVYFKVEDLYGYSALKPRGFQDFADVVGLANPALWNILNVKYLILEKPVEYAGLKPVYQDNSSAVMLNTNAKGRFYFADSLETGKPIEYLRKMKAGFYNNANIAFAENMPSVNIEKPDSSAYIKYIKFDHRNYELEVNATGNNLLCISNTFYPHAWKTEIDGKPADMFKVNHGYSGVIIPKGKHIIKTYISIDTFNIGKIITLILNTGFIALFAAGIFFQLKNKNKE